MPRILRIINRFNLGGPTYNAAYLTRYLPEAYETMLIGGQKDESEDSSQFILENLGIKPTILPEMRRNINYFKDIAAYNRIRSIIAAYKPDIVHTHASKSGALGRLAAHQMGVPVIIHTFHGHVFNNYFSPFKTGLYKRLERHLAGISSGIVAISNGQRNELVEEHRIVSSDKCMVIPLGFDLVRFMEELPKKRAHFRRTFQLRDEVVAIGIIGRLVPIKNHRMFLRALASLKWRTLERFQAFIVGDGEERRNLEAYTRSLGLTHASGPDPSADVVFTSWIKNVDYVNAGMDIIALTSKNEGTPVSLIEAQASCKPIVTTQVGGIKDIVIPGETALLSGLDDESGFIDNLLCLINSAQLRADLSKKGQEFVKETYTYQRLVNDMDSFYQEKLATSR